MYTNRELDRLLNRLRQDTSTRDLGEVERRVWQQIAQLEGRVQRPEMRLSLVLASVVVAFAWGIFTGGDATPASPATSAFLVEEMDLLPPDFGNLLL